MSDGYVAIAGGFLRIYSQEKHAAVFCRRAI